MPAVNAKQATIPRGARLVPNPRGTAAGFELRWAGAVVFALPGVPAEMRTMFEASVAPAIARSVGRRREHVVRRDLYCYGAGESTVALKLGRLMDQSRNPKVGTLASEGVIQVKIVGAGANRARVEREVVSAARTAARRLGPLVFSDKDPNIAAAVVEELDRRGLKIAVGESCTL